MSRKISRRKFLIAGAGSVAAVGIGYLTKDYWSLLVQDTISIKPTPSSTPIGIPTPSPTPTPVNPVIAEYGDKLPLEIINKIKILGEDEIIDENEQLLIDILTDIESKRGRLEEKNLQQQSAPKSPQQAELYVTEMEEKLADSSIQEKTVTSETGRALGYILQNGTDIRDNLIENSQIDRISLELLEESLSRSDIDEIDPDLIYEIIRLPDSKIDKEKFIDAMHDVLELAANPNYKSTFEKIMSEGIPESRMQLTPLECLVWIDYEYGLNYLESLFGKNYSLKYLISIAWKKTSLSKNYESERWKNFDEVVNRLNSPDLVSIYMKDNVSWRAEKENEYVPAEIIFKRGYDDCDGHATLQSYFLKANGYEAWSIGLSVEGPVGHNVCGYIINEKIHILDNEGEKVGPFNSWDEVSDIYARKGWAEKNGSIVLFDPFDITSISGNPFSYKHERIS